MSAASVKQLSPYQDLGCIAPNRHSGIGRTDSCHYDTCLCSENPLSLSDMHIIIETKISRGNSTIIPAEIRRSLGINPGDILIWTLDNHEIKVKPRKKMQFKDIVGLTEGGRDSVSAKKRIQRGE